MLDNFDNFTGKNFYRGLIQEYGLADDVDSEAALSFYKKGLLEEKDHFCAAKLLLYHIEPMTLNNDLPDNNGRLSIY